MKNSVLSALIQTKFSWNCRVEKNGDFIKDLAPLLFGDISLDMFAAFIYGREICLQLENDACLTTYLVQIFDNMNDIQSHSVSN